MTSAATSTATAKPRATIAAVAAMLLASALLSYLAAVQQSPTFDEPLHATAGYAIRWMNDYRIDVEDPALFPLLTTLGSSADDLRIDPNDPGLTALLHEHNRQWETVIRAMFRTPRPDQQSVYSGVAYIDRARFVFLLIHALLGGLIAWWAYRLAGAPAALIAAALFAFDPNFLAHGSQVKNDVPMALLMLWMMYATWEFGRRGTALRFGSIALACALAVNVKFSGLLMGTMLVATLITRACVRDDWSIFGKEFHSRSRRVPISIALCVAVALICWLAIWTTYRWRFSMSPDPSIRFDDTELVKDAKLRLAAVVGSHPEGMTESQVAAYQLARQGRTILWLDEHHVFPDAWLHGLFYTWYTSIYRHAFLLGRFSLTGWWYYFPLAMLFKTPLSTLVAMAILSARWITQRVRSRDRHAPSWDAMCLWLPILIYGIAAMRANLDIGIRHILPVYPFIYILMGVGFSRWMHSWKRARAIAIALVILSSAETLAHWPHEIPFFNLAAGGSTGGMRLLSDSNLDWGQDLPLLAEWQQHHPGKRMYLAYFGSVDPHAYGIEYVNIPGGYPFSELPAQTPTSPGVLAISATFLQGTYESANGVSIAGFLKGREPIVSLGGSLYVYDWEPAEFARYLQAHASP